MALERAQCGGENGVILAPLGSAAEANEPERWYLLQAFGLSAQERLSHELAAHCDKQGGRAARPIWVADASLSCRTPRRVGNVPSAS